MRSLRNVILGKALFSYVDRHLVILWSGGSTTPGIFNYKRPGGVDNICER